MNLLPRIWARRSLTPGGCWEWSGAHNSEGYGQLKVRQDDGSVHVVKLHRLIYEVFIGPIPEGQLVCHRCDNPGCFNPDHLFTGTPRDNILDMIRKGRRGIAHRLTPARVWQIRSLLASGWSYRKVAAHMGISSTHVGSIAAGKAWSAHAVGA